MIRGKRNSSENIHENRNNNREESSTLWASKKEKRRDNPREKKKKKKKKEKREKKSSKQKSSSHTILYETGDNSSDGERVSIGKGSISLFSQESYGRTSIDTFEPQYDIMGKRVDYYEDDSESDYSSDLSFDD